MMSICVVGPVRNKTIHVCSFQSSVFNRIFRRDAGLCNTVVVGYARDAWSRTHRSAEAKALVAANSEAQALKEFGPEFGLFGQA